jgi:YidC/Oxa1 family membrane protein insertase
MSSLGMNLADSAQKALSHGAGTAAPYIILVMAVAGTSYYQQRQIAGRPGASSVNPQQQMLLKIMPVFFAFISLTLPAGLVVYFLVSNVFRIGQQALITRTMYKEDHGAIEAKGREVDTSSTKSGGLFAGIREQAAAASAQSSKRDPKPAANGGASAKKKAGGGSSPARQNTPKPSGAKKPAAGPSRAAPSAANRSRTKKKRK